MKKMMMMLVMMMMFAVAASAETTWNDTRAQATLTFTDKGRMIIEAPGKFLGMPHGNHRTKVRWHLTNGKDDPKPEVNGEDNDVLVLRDGDTIELPKKAVEAFQKYGPRYFGVAVVAPTGKLHSFFFDIAGGGK
jgi:hypothetical protein